MAKNTNYIRMWEQIYGPRREFIRDYRSRGESRYHAAARVGISHKTLQRWEEEEGLVLEVRFADEPQLVSSAAD